MLHPSGFAIALLLHLLVLVTVHVVPCTAKRPNHHHLCTSSCGNIRNISYPFRLKDDPQSCGRRQYELTCENNRTIMYSILYPGKLRVEEINYGIFTVRVVDDSSSLPLQDPPHIIFNPGGHSFRFQLLDGNNTLLNLIDCEAPINSPRYVYMAPHCTRSTKNTSSNRTLMTYAVVGSMELSDLENSCRMKMVVSVSGRRQKTNHNTTTCSGIHDLLLYGTDLRWSSNCPPCDFDPFGFIPQYIWKLLGIVLGGAFLVIVGLILALRFLLVCPCVIILMIYEWRRRKSSIYHLIQHFLGPQNNLTPIRYSYSNIKKMTKGFREKLGQGGYGSVYKGKLRSGRIVAVKMLVGSRTDGQDFINEVATIGRIHHVNVVRLMGFCVQGSKRALVYDFMPNGSLDKYIFPEKEESISLSLEKIYEISLGIAHGIEYLHRGCDTQILHFDIKPHNILLDKDFIPKISDFGLAKSYPVDNSIVSLTAARGTRGYMAPELFYKNIGGVSHKADVYSFGMTLMEMAGRRRNLNVYAENSSQFYFPTWIYDKFSEGKDIELMEDATEEEKQLLVKLIVVALWCIQLKPNDRPSMNKVVEMLEGNAELLQMPPRPLLTPQEPPAEVHLNNKNPTEMSISIG